LAVLDALDDGAFRMLSGRATELAAELQKVINEAGLAVQVPVVESLVGIFFADEPPGDFQQAQAADAKTYARFFHAMLERGIALPPSPFEVLFPSLAHTRGELERTVDLAAAAARAVA
jgi:glutamate-1-semialdehyde 2,1-aminomutase